MSAPSFNAETLAAEMDGLISRLESGKVTPDGVLAALTELRSSVEELRIVEDELVRSAEDLAAAHAEIDFERKRYEDLFALAPDAHVVTDHNGKVLEANLAAEALFQVPRRFIEGKPIVSFVVPASRREFRTMLTSAGRSFSGSVGTFRIRRRDGVLFDARVTVAPVLDRERRPTALRFVFRDVTDELQSEARLWELNAELEARVEERAGALEAAHAQLDDERVQFEVVLKHLPAAVLLVDAEGTIGIRNVRAEEMFPPDVERIDELLAQLLAGDGGPLHANALAPSTESEGASVRYRQNGREVLLDATAAPIARDGTRSGTIYVFRDVTEQKRRDVAQRQFVVNAAHELRTPLAAIVSAVDVLQGGAKDDEEARDRFLEHLERQSARLTALVRSLLLLARAQAGVEEPRQELAPIRPLLEELAASMSVAPSVDVIVDCDANLAALTNRELLVQSLVNLVTNAARFTRKGTIVLRAAPIDDAHVAIEVADSGPGVPPEELEHAQDRFFRGAESGRDGFGLGLSIAAEAARAAGGDLQLESEQGRGTTARVVVPLARLVET